MAGILARGLHQPAAILMAVSLVGAMAPAAAQEAPATPPAALNAHADGAMFDQAPISDGELAATTGREKSNWMSASSNNSAVVANNSVGDNNMTGDVNVTDSAFQNVSGISMVNFNTGNNSSINAAMSINLQITYAQPGMP